MSTATAARQRTRQRTGAPGYHDHTSSVAAPAGPRGGRRHAHTSPVRRRGSRQQVSVRGRRIAVPSAAERSVVRTWVVLLLLFVAGVAFAMYLSGKTTEQSYQLSEAESTSTTLSNELESLHRDVEDASSTQRIAAEASRLGMVVPGQSGVLDVNGEEVREVRPADPAATLPVTDINGRTPAQRPTSDPEATGQVPGLAPQALDPGRDDAPAAPGAQQDQQARGGDSTGELPY